MSLSGNPPPGVPGAVGSERFRLARLAREAALRVPGVAGTDTGAMGLFVTVGEGQRLEGVICAATRDDGYEVCLRLVCELVPLPSLGEQVKTAVTRSAALAEIALESVSVTVAAVTQSDDQ